VYLNFVLFCSVSGKPRKGLRQTSRLPDLLSDNVKELRRISLPPYLTHQNRPRYPIHVAPPSVSQPRKGAAKVNHSKSIFQEYFTLFCINTDYQRNILKNTPRVCLATTGPERTQPLFGDRENNTFPQTGHPQKYFIPSLFHITLNRKEKKLKLPAPVTPQPVRWTFHNRRFQRSGIGF
jgi:hypothetical protein